MVVLVVILLHCSNQNPGARVALTDQRQDPRYVHLPGSDSGEGDVVLCDGLSARANDISTAAVATAYGSPQYVAEAAAWPQAALRELASAPRTFSGCHPRFWSLAHA